MTVGSLAVRPSMKPFLPESAFGPRTIVFWVGEFRVRAEARQYDFAKTVQPREGSQFWTTEVSHGHIKHGLV